jgi:hypothetical protein
VYISIYVEYLQPGRVTQHGSQSNILRNQIYMYIFMYVTLSEHAHDDSKEEENCPAGHAGHVRVPVPRSTTGWFSGGLERDSAVLLLLPSPSCPYEFSPQHLVVPSSRTAQVVLYPQLMLSAVQPMPMSTLLSRSPISLALSPRCTVSPYPSCPCPLAPQHFTSQLSSSAHV